MVRTERATGEMEYFEVANLSTAFILSTLTPRNPQKNHSGQQFWPNLFLGRWLKGLAFQKSEK